MEWPHGLTTPSPSLRLYQARADSGEPVSVMATIDHAGDDVGIYLVATHPDHRGRGLASRLLAAALDEAKQRGMQTSSLQGSPMGAPIYARLGYSGDFRMTCTNDASRVRRATPRSRSRQPCRRCRRRALLPRPKP